jgi:hypothetical protein
VEKIYCISGYQLITVRLSANNNTLAANQSHYTHYSMLSADNDIFSSDNNKMLSADNSRLSDILYINMI